MYILAIGSPHGDDQAAWHVAEVLRGRGIGSTYRIQNVDQILGYLSHDVPIILIDACSSGALPGSIFRWRWPHPRISDPGGVSSHGIDIAYALGMAEALGRLPEDIIVYGIELRSTEPVAEVSPEVAAAVERVAEMILEELTAKGLVEQCMNDP